MQQHPSHGERLSGEEFDRRVVALHTGLPPVPSREQQRAVRRAELDLAIDHRLGQAFPRDRRDALWAIQERVERRRLALIAWHLIRHLVPGALEARAKGLAGYLVREYAKVLTPGELDEYFGSNAI